MKNKLSGYILKDKIKICGKDKSGKRFTKLTNTTHCRHYNTQDANYYQMGVNVKTNKPKWFYAYTK